MKRIVGRNYAIELDENTGGIISLRDTKKTDANWIAEAENTFFGVPFINGTQWEENNVPCKLIRCTDTEAEVESCEGAIKIGYHFEETRVICSLKMVSGCGPRAGLQMDWNFFDMPGSGSWQQQCMPHILYTDEEYEYAYLVFATADHRYAAITIQGFSAWRIKYSYPGHRMVGFQILTQADDVVTTGKKPLPVSENVNISIFLVNTEKECLKRNADILHIVIAIPEISGGTAGTTIPFDIVGKYKSVSIVSSNGIEQNEKGNKIILAQEGLYQIDVTTEYRKHHVSRVLCHRKWEALFDQVNAFYKDNFQDESGAFYRAVWSDTCSPKNGFTLEGTAFGDINALYSCRSGEFGGFAGWAMMKNCILFGEKPELVTALNRYVYNWVLNQGHESNPYNGTICKGEQEYLGRKYGPYHLYHEVNVPQHEAFFLEQLVDFYQITKKREILDEAICLAHHFVAEHMESNGMVVCQNTPDGEKIDYCTVHVPICGLIKLAEIIRETNVRESRWLFERAEKLADYVCARALSFPTEGEACTEDGSMSCSAITLLWAYQHISQKEKYLQTANVILDYHEALVLNGTDCRQKNSSVRFWETQYESRDWGPSINAGHAWSIWTAEAKALLAQVTGNIERLKEAYEGFITNICKVQENGAMPSCFTPEMIPGLPHKPCVWGGTYVPPEITELRPTTTYLAMDFVKKTYACSGNYFLVKAAEIWNHISGLDLKSGVGINGVFANNHFKSNAVTWDFLVLYADAQATVVFECVPYKQIQVATVLNLDRLIIKNAEIKNLDQNHILITPDNRTFTIEIQ